MQEKLVMKFLVHVEDDDVQHKGGLHYQLVTSGMSMQTRRQCFSHPRTAMAIKFQGNDILIVPIFPEFFIFSSPNVPKFQYIPTTCLHTIVLQFAKLSLCFSTTGN